MDVLYHRCAGLDVHAETIVVCALVGEEEHIQKEIEPFPTFTKDLFRLLKWLEDRRITHIAMESTGVYGKPVFNILEDYFDITLANAQRIKNVPGRKTDVLDAEWMAKLLRHGLIEKGFVPPADIRELRDLTRLRKKWMGQLTAEKNLIHKVLECSNIKLSAVISDIFGASGRKLLDRLMKQGYIEEWEIDACIHGRMKEKKAQIQESLFGTLTAHQLFMIRQSWKHIEYLESLIQEMDHRIDQLLQADQQELELLMTIPGVKKETAAVIIAEIGVDMGQFPTSQHLASWAGVAPGNHESAGKRKSTRTTKGNPHIKSALCEAAWALSRCKNQRLAAKFWSLKSRRGTKKALVAIAHRVLIIVYYMLSRKEPFREQPTH